ncbi:MAG: hypothetical protein ACK4UU_05765, partial [Fimbriimonadales bacterium]
MRKFLVFLGIASATALLAWGWLRQHEISYAQQRFHLGLLLGEQNGYLLMPPEFVAQPFIRSIEWSPDGNYAVLIQTAVRTTGSGEDFQAELRHRILAWSRKTKRLSVLWESALTDVEIDPRRDVQVAFFKNAPACLLAVREDKWGSGGAEYSWAVYHSPLDGRATKLGDFARAILLAPPEDEPRYLMWYQTNPETNSVNYLYAPISPTGKLGAPRPLPASAYDIVRYAESDYVMWYVDGKQVVCRVLLPEAPDEAQDAPTSRYRIRYTLWNPRTNQEREISSHEVRPYEPPMPRTALHVTHSRQPVRHKEAHGTTQLTWLGEG